MGEIESRKFGWVSRDRGPCEEETFRLLVSPSTSQPWLSGIKSFRLSGPFGLLGPDIDVPPSSTPG